MNDEFDKIMQRIKNLGEYEVEYILPEDFNFSGVVPFDMSICSGVAHVKVIAVSLEEAMKKVENYFEGGNYEH
jgi:hypothetical protein